MKRILKANEDKADEIRKTLAEKKILMVNLISSPGSGKTSLLDKTLGTLKNTYRMAVIEGDVATDRDAQRLKQHDLPIVLINTEGGCHLNSMSIEKALSELDLANLDIVFVENVGNLVCPSGFDLGEAAKVALVSVPEGEDKPIKYPMLFRKAEIVLLNKIDLLEHLPYDINLFYDCMQNLNNEVPILEISCINEQGLAQWFDWLKEKRASCLT